MVSQTEVLQCLSANLPLHIVRNDKMSKQICLHHHPACIFSLTYELKNQELQRFQMTSFYFNYWKNLKKTHQTTPPKTALHERQHSTLFLAEQKTGNSMSFVKNSSFGSESSYLKSALAGPGSTRKAKQNLPLWIFCNAWTIFAKTSYPKNMQNFNTSSCLRIMDANQETSKPAWKYVVQGLPAGWLGSQKFYTENPLCSSLQIGSVITPFPDEQTGHCQASQVRDRGQPEEHHPEPTSLSHIVDNAMDGTTEYLEETWYCFCEHQAVLMFISSSVKLRQHIWDAEEALCAAACLSKTHQEGSKSDRIHIQCSVEDSNFSFVGNTKYSKQIPLPPPLK